MVYLTKKTIQSIPNDVASRWWCSLIVYCSLDIISVHQIVVCTEIASNVHHVVLTGKLWIICFVMAIFDNPLDVTLLWSLFTAFQLSYVNC